MSDESFRASLKEAHGYLATGRPGDAECVLTSAIRESGTTSASLMCNAWMLLGVAKGRQGHHKAAETALRRAAELAKRKPARRKLAKEVYQNLGKCLEAQGMDEAVEWFRRTREFGVLAQGKFIKKRLLDVEQRIDRLFCLPAALKDTLQPIIHEFRARGFAEYTREQRDELMAHLTEYQNNHLTLVEQWIEPLSRPSESGGSPEFHAVCLRLGPIRELRPLAKALGLKFNRKIDPLAQWYLWAAELQAQPARRLYALAGYWTVALPVLLLGYPTIDDDAYLRGLTADCIRSLGSANQAVGCLESWLRLEPIAYQDRQTLRDALLASPLADIGWSVALDQVLTSLADALRLVDDRGPRDAVMLLETWLGLEPEAFDDRGVLDNALAASQLGDEILVSLANALRLADDRGPRHALLLLESWLRLEPEAFENRQTLRKALAASPLADIDDAGGWADVVISLAEALQLVDNRGPRDVMVLLESWLELEPEVFENREILRKALASGPLPDIDIPDAWAVVLLSLADALRLIDGRGARHAVVLLESWLELEPKAFEDRQTLRAALAAGPLARAGAPSTWAEFLVSLADSLMFVEGRGRRQAVVLLESWLQLEPAAYEDRHTLREALAASPLAETGPVTGSNVVTMLASALRAVDDRGPHHAVALLESWLELEPKTFENRETLRDALASGPLADIGSTVTCANVLTCLADSLRSVGGRRVRHAVVLLETWLRLEPEAFEDRERLHDALAHSPLASADAPVGAWANCLTALADSLRLVDVRGDHHAGVLFEGWLELEPEAFKNEENLREALAASPLGHIEASVAWGNVLHSIGATALTDPNRGSEATRRLWDAAFEGVPAWEIGDRGRFAKMPVRHRLMVAKQYLACLDSTEEDAWRLCGAMVRWIETVRQQDLATPQKRLDFLRDVGAVRRDFCRVGTAHIAKAERRGDPAGAATRSLALLDWLELLENRSLIEQLFAHRAVADDEAPAATAWSRGWPYRDPVWTTDLAEEWQRRWRHGMAGEDRWTFPNAMALPLEMLYSETSNVLARSGQAFDVQSHGPRDTGRLAGATALDSETEDRLWHLPSRLRELLRSRVLLLRTVFDEAGRLWWWIVCNATTEVQIVASGRSGVGAVERLGRATLRFDLAVERTWWRQKLRMATTSVWTADERGILNDLIELVRDPGAADDLRPAEGWATWGSAVKLALDRTREQAPLFVGLGTCLLEMTLDEIEGRQRRSDADVCVSLLDAFEESFGTACVLPSPARTRTEQREMERERRAESDRATEEHVAALAQELDLSPLLETVEFDFEDMDMLCQVQGPLWTFPLALLPIGSRTLGEQVASLSSVVSLGLWHFSEHGLVVDSLDSRNVLSAQWLDRHERCHMQGLAGLEALLQAITEDAHWNQYSLGDDPRADCVQVSAGLRDRQRRFALAILGGHGDANRAGVKFADGLWQGDGGDLASVDLLFLVACAVGRLKQRIYQGEGDVTGLYARLASCRAVIAARWPIADIEAAVFAAEFIREYLQATNENDGLLPLFARARLLNQVRLRLTTVAPGSEVSPVSQHLAHAFELYGLG